MGLILASGSEGGEVNVLALPLYEIIIGSVAFAIVFGVFAKFVLPKISKALEERADQIEGGIERAEKAQAEAKAALAHYQEQLANANGEAAQIRTSAQAEGKSIVDAAKADAATQAKAMLDRAELSVSAERASAMSSLQRDVGALALELAGRIVGENLSDDARARASVDRFIAELETSTEASR